MVNADGSQEPIPEFDRASDKVYIIVDHQARVVFLWKGLSAGVRLKFIGSRAMGDKRKEVGFHYKIDVNDQDDESRSFKKSFGEETGPGVNVFEDEGSVPSYAEAAAAQGISISEDELRAKTAADSSLPGHVAKMGGLTSRPQKSFLADDAFMSGEEPSAEVVKPVKVTKATTRQVAGQLHASNIDEAQNLLDELGKPKGFQREMVVVGNRVYRSTGGDEGGDPVKFEEMENPLDGLFMVKEYTPRLVCENGRVIAIELLKTTGEEIGEDEYSMSQDLEDLAAMFQIEID
ncbi:MAG: hypothetical protein ACXAD7_26720 [Candidatus Kariarchaeaceae archaeon]